MLCTSLALVAMHVGGWVVRVSRGWVTCAREVRACVSLSDFLRGLWRWGVDSVFTSVYHVLMLLAPTTPETPAMHSLATVFLSRVKAAIAAGDAHAAYRAAYWLTSYATR